MIAGETLEQQFLRRHGLTLPRRFLVVHPLRAHLPRLAVVLEIGLQALVDDALLELGIEDGKTDLYPPEEVAVHPVRAGEVDILGAIVVEVEHARVLEESTDDGTHPNVLR